MTNVIRLAKIPNNSTFNFRTPFTTHHAKSKSSNCGYFALKRDLLLEQLLQKRKNHIDFPRNERPHDHNTFPVDLQGLMTMTMLIPSNLSTVNILGKCKGNKQYKIRLPLKKNILKCPSSYGLFQSWDFKHRYTLADLDFVFKSSKQEKQCVGRYKEIKEKSEKEYEQSMHQMLPPLIKQSFQYSKMITQGCQTENKVTQKSFDWIIKREGSKCNYKKFIPKAKKLGKSVILK